MLKDQGQDFDHFPVSAKPLEQMTPVASMSKSALDLPGDDTEASRSAAIRAIERVVARIEGLHNFTNAYRALTYLPQPVVRAVNLAEWLDVLRESLRDNGLIKVLCWTVMNHRQYPHLLWARYLDDGLIHCQTEAEALAIMAALSVTNGVKLRHVGC